MKAFVPIVFLGLILVGCKTSSQIESSKSEGITEKYWKLIELNGKQVVLDTSTGGRDAFIILRNKNNRLHGNTGCNTLVGTYEITPARYRIQFMQMATTLRACMNMEVENELKKVLELANNYAMTADGKYLLLTRGRMAPLTRFEVVYLE